MTSFTNLVETLEKLAFEIFLWIIFIPKTLFKIIWNPSWVPGYVDEELAKEKGRFSEYLSPLILLTIIVIGMAGVIQWVGTLSGVEAVIPAKGVAGEQSVLFAKPKFIWSDGFLFSTWVIKNNANDIPDVFVRHNFDLSNTEDPRVSKFNTVINSSEGFGKNINREEYFNGLTFGPSGSTAENYTSPVSQLTYTWEKPGIYSVGIVFVGNNGGTIYSNIYNVSVSNVNATTIDAPFIENNDQSLSFISIIPSEFKALFRESIFTNRELSISLLLIVLILPLSFALLIHVLQEGNMSRSGLQRHLYIQTMYFAPLLFSGLLCVFIFVELIEYIPHINFLDEWYPNHFDEVVTLSLLGWYSFPLFFAWFLAAETKFLLRELKKNALAFLFSLGSIVLISIFVTIYNFDISFKGITTAKALIEVLAAYPLIILFGMLGIVSDLLGVSENYSSLRIVISIYFVVICLPPVAYFSSKFLPLIWKYITQPIIHFAEKHGRLQRLLNFFKRKNAKNNKE